MAMVKQAESEESVEIKPSMLNTEPWLLTVLNGTIDLRTGKLRPHDPGDLIMKLAGVEYDPDADCPLWEKSQLEIADGDAELVAFKQRWYGYCLTGDVSERKLAILYGEGRNGKSTELGVVKALLGDSDEESSYARNVQFDTFSVRYGEGPRNDLARLVGARLVTAIESSEGKRLDVALIKQLTGGEDTVTARFLRQEFFEFRPNFKICLATNHKPVINDSNRAIWDRLLLIPYPVIFEGDDCDKNLPEKLKTELPGILNWMLEGLRRYLREGLTVPDSVKAATEGYRSESNVLAEWVADRCETGLKLFDSAAALHESYLDWAKRHAGVKLNSTQFGRALGDSGFEAGGQRKIGGKPLRVRLGLKLLPSGVDYSEFEAN
jgi:putative DNA primase/helicase